MFHIPFHPFSPRQKRIAPMTRIMTLLSNTIESRTTLPSQWLRFENRQWDQTWIPPIIRRNDNPTWNPYQWWARSGLYRTFLPSSRTWHDGLCKGTRHAQCGIVMNCHVVIFFTAKNIAKILCGRDIFCQLPIVHQYSEKSQLTELSTCSRIGDALDIDHIPLGFDVGDWQGMHMWHVGIYRWFATLFFTIKTYSFHVSIAQSNGQRSNKFTVNYVVKSL